MAGLFRLLTSDPERRERQRLQEYQCHVGQDYDPFHEKCGRSVFFSDKKSIASRKADSYNGILFSAKPIQLGGMFQVKLLHKGRIWSGSLAIGFTLQDPDNIDQMHISATDLTRHKDYWMFSGNKVYHNWNDRELSVPNPSLNEGDSVGCRITRGGCFEIYINGLKRAVGWYNVPVDKPLWGVVEMYGGSMTIQSEFYCDIQCSIDMPLEEKRKHYKCGKRYRTLEKVPTLADDGEREANSMVEGKGKKLPCSVIPELCQKVSLWRGDITILEVDAIVIDSDSTLLGGVSAAIHNAAGRFLRKECTTLGGCSTGDAKITGGYMLPAKYVIHAVGPTTHCPDQLESCYKRSLEHVIDKGIKSVAFQCIATGVLGSPSLDAAHIALTTVREWMEEHSDEIDRVIFCVSLDTDLNMYTHLLRKYFPIEPVAVPQQRMSKSENTFIQLEAMTQNDSERIPPLKQSVGHKRQDQLQVLELKQGNQEQASQIEQLKEVQQDHTSQLDKHTSQLEEHTSQLEEHTSKLEQIQQKHTSDLRQLQQEHTSQLEHLQQQLTAHFQQQLEKQLEEQKRQIQEIQQQFQGQLVQLQSRIQSLQPSWSIDHEHLEITEQVLGRGAYGEVRVGIHQGTKVAVKKMYDVIISNHNCELFVREMRIASRVRHPNLVLFIGAVTMGNLTIVSELMETSLRKLMEGKKLKASDIRPISQDVACALVYLHSLPDPIVHRDVSSANVLLNTKKDGWQAKLGDFGSANFLAKLGTVGPGCVLYAAPEAVNPGNQGPKMDVYSFGVLLLEVCVGKLMDQHTLESTKVAVVNWSDPSKKSLGEWSKRCTERDPDKRPNMAEFVRQF